MKHLVFALLSLSLVACSSTRKSADVASESAGQLITNEANTSSRAKIITARQSVEVEEMAAAEKQLRTSVENLGGFFESSYMYDKGLNATHTIKVPSEKTTVALDSFASLGVEKQRTMSAQDVTDSLVDLKARLLSAKKMRARLEKLLAKATTMADILEIETKIQSVQNDIERMEARLSNTQNDVKFSAITVRLNQKRILGPLGYLAYGAYWTLEKLFFIK